MTSILTFFVLASTQLTSPVGPQAPSIFGGGPVEPCAWPSTVSVGLEHCSGVLVAPDLVLTAAHCVANSSEPARSVFFGDRGTRTEFTALEVPAQCEGHPGWVSGSTEHDIAFCRLERPVDVPYTMIATGCELDELHEGREVLAVGFGTSDDNAGFGLKRSVAMEVTHLDEIEIGAGGAGLDTCGGDSGGPLFMALTDGSWRLVGITSMGGPCGQGGRYFRVAKALEWIESSSGTDVTPCGDVEGHWDPGPSCGGELLDPSAPGASWSESCLDTQFKNAATTCGAATSDFDPPFRPSQAAAGCRVDATGESKGRVVWLLGLLVVLRRRKRGGLDE